MIGLKVSDLKQWGYCRRILFFNYVLGLSEPATYKMERGKEEQGRMEELQRRREVRIYGFEGAERRFEVGLESEKIGLCGVVDMVLEVDGCGYPVDFKRSRSVMVRKSHRLQLGGYALLLGEEYGVDVPFGFVHFMPDERVVKVKTDENLKGETLRVLDEIRGMVEKEVFPEEAAYEARCSECYYVSYCRDSSAF